MKTPLINIALILSVYLLCNNLVKVVCAGEIYHVSSDSSFTTPKTPPLLSNGGSKVIEIILTDKIYNEKEIDLSLFVINRDDDDDDTVVIAKPPTHIHIRSIHNNSDDPPIIYTDRIKLPIISGAPLRKIQNAITLKIENIRFHHSRLKDNAQQRETTDQTKEKQPWSTTTMIESTTTNLLSLDIINCEFNGYESVVHHEGFQPGSRLKIVDSKFIQVKSSPVKAMDMFSVVIENCFLNIGNQPLSLSFSKFSKESGTETTAVFSFRNNVFSSFENDVDDDVDNDDDDDDGNKESLFSCDPARDQRRWTTAIEIHHLDRRIKTIDIFNNSYIHNNDNDDDASPDCNQQRMLRLVDSDLRHIIEQQQQKQQRNNTGLSPLLPHTREYLIYLLWLEIQIKTIEYSHGEYNSFTLCTDGCKQELTTTTTTTMKNDTRNQDDSCLLTDDSLSLSLSDDDDDDDGQQILYSVYDHSDIKTAIEYTIRNCPHDKIFLRLSDASMNGQDYRHHPFEKSSVITIDRRVSSSSPSVLLISGFKTDQIFPYSFNIVDTGTRLTKLTIQKLDIRLPPKIHHHHQNDYLFTGEGHIESIAMINCTVKSSKQTTPSLALIPKDFCNNVHIDNSRLSRIAIHLNDIHSFYLRDSRISDESFVSLSSSSSLSSKNNIYIDSNSFDNGGGDNNDDDGDGGDILTIPYLIIDNCTLPIVKSNSFSSHGRPSILLKNISDLSQIRYNEFTPGTLSFEIRQHTLTKDVTTDNMVNDMLFNNPRSLGSSYLMVSMGQRIVKKVSSREMAIIQCTVDPSLERESHQEFLYLETALSHCDPETPIIIKSSNRQFHHGSSWRTNLSNRMISSDNSDRVLLRGYVQSDAHLTLDDVSLDLAGNNDLRWPYHSFIHPSVHSLARTTATEEQSSPSSFSLFVNNSTLYFHRNTDVLLTTRTSNRHSHYFKIANEPRIHIKFTNSNFLTWSYGIGDDGGGGTIIKEKQHRSRNRLHSQQSSTIIVTDLFHVKGKYDIRNHDNSSFYCKLELENNYFSHYHGRIVHSRFCQWKLSGNRFESCQGHSPTNHHHLIDLGYCPPGSELDDDGGGSDHGQGIAIVVDSNSFIFNQKQRQTSPPLSSIPYSASSSVIWIHDCDKSSIISKGIIHNNTIEKHPAHSIGLKFSRIKPHGLELADLRQIVSQSNCNVFGGVHDIVYDDDVAIANDSPLLLSIGTTDVDRTMIFCDDESTTTTTTTKVNHQQSSSSSVLFGKPDLCKCASEIPKYCIVVSSVYDSIINEHLYYGDFYFSSLNKALFHCKSLDRIIEIDTIDDDFLKRSIAFSLQYKQQQQRFRGDTNSKGKWQNSSVSITEENLLLISKQSNWTIRPYRQYDQDDNSKNHHRSIIRGCQHQSYIEGIEFQDIQFLPSNECRSSLWDNTKKTPYTSSKKLRSISFKRCIFGSTTPFPDDLNSNTAAAVASSSSSSSPLNNGEDDHGHLKHLIRLSNFESIQLNECYFSRLNSLKSTIWLNNVKRVLISNNTFSNRGEVFLEDCPSVDLHRNRFGSPDIIPEIVVVVDHGGDDDNHLRNPVLKSPKNLVVNPKKESLLPPPPPRRNTSHVTIKRMNPVDVQQYINITKNEIYSSLKTWGFLLSNIDRWNYTIEGNVITKPQVGISVTPHELQMVDFMGIPARDDHHRRRSGDSNNNNNGGGGTSVRHKPVTQTTYQTTTTIQQWLEEINRVNTIESSGSNVVFGNSTDRFSVEFALLVTNAKYFRDPDEFVLCPNWECSMRDILFLIVIASMIGLFCVFCCLILCGIQRHRGIEMSRSRLFGGMWVPVHRSDYQGRKQVEEAVEQMAQRYDSSLYSRRGINQFWHEQTDTLVEPDYSLSDIEQGKAQRRYRSYHEMSSSYKQRQEQKDLLLL